MAKNNNYEISDSLWGRATQYASAVWDSWTKDVDECLVIATKNKLR